MPWLLNLQFRIEENIHNDDVASRVFQITLRGLSRISFPNGQTWRQTTIKMVWILLKTQTLKRKIHSILNVDDKRVFRLGSIKGQPPNPKFSCTFHASPHLPSIFFLLLCSFSPCHLDVSHSIFFSWGLLKLPSSSS